MEDGNATESRKSLGRRHVPDTPRDTEPETASEEAAFSKWMDQTSERQVARLDRLQGAQGIIAPALWVVLLLTAAVIVGYMMLFADSGERALSQAMLIGCVVTVVTATMILIRVLENPYSFGTGALEPTAMESTLRILGEFESIADQAPLPCDDNGVLLNNEHRHARPAAEQSRHLQRFEAHRNNPPCARHRCHCMEQLPGESLERRAVESRRQRQRASH